MSLPSVSFRRVSCMPSTSSNSFIVHPIFATVTAAWSRYVFISFSLLCKRMALGKQRPDIIVLHRIVEHDRNPTALVNVICRIATVIGCNTSGGIIHFDVKPLSSKSAIKADIADLLLNGSIPKR